MNCFAFIFPQSFVHLTTNIQNPSLILEDLYKSKYNKSLHLGDSRWHSTKAVFWKSPWSVGYKDLPQDLVSGLVFSRLEKRENLSLGLSTLLCAPFPIKHLGPKNSSFHLLRIYYVTHTYMYYFWSLHQLAGSEFHPHCIENEAQWISVHLLRRRAGFQPWV